MEKDNKEALKQIQDYVGPNGLVPFEHGFKRPTFNFNGYKYKYSMVSDRTVYGRKYFANGSSRNCNLYLNILPERTLKSIYKNLLKYEEYCLKEA